MDYMDPDVLCPQKKPINSLSLNLSLNLSLPLNLSQWPDPKRPES